MSALLLITPLFIVMALGYLLKKSGVLTEEFVTRLNALLLKLLLPALLFRSTSGADISELGLPAVGFLSAVLIGATLAIAVSFLMPTVSRGAFVQSAFRGNLAYLGLPVVSATLGEQAIPVAAAILAVGLIAHVALTIILLQLLNPQLETRSVGANIRSVVTNPLILGVLAGLLFSTLPVELPYILAETLDLLSRGALPMALLLIGCTISFREIGERVGITILAVGWKLLLLPAVAWLLMETVFSAPVETTRTVVIMAASPTAILAQTFAHAFKADVRLAAATVALSTILGILAFPLWTTLLGL